MTAVRVRAIAAALAVVALAAGCGSAGADRGEGTVQVVASTNVYGELTDEIAGSLAGGRVTVRSLIADPDTDPHSYEANARDLLAIKDADLVIENGGGYDDFVDTMRRSVHSSAVVLNAVRISGKTAPAGGDLNEHVWYDFPTARRVVTRIAAALAAADQRDATTYRANAAALLTRIGGLQARAAAVRARFGGAGVAITEPVPLYLLAACGLVNRTPPAFSAAVEADLDVSVRGLQQTLDLFTRPSVRVLVYNAQTAGAETTRLTSAARAHHVPVVAVTETMPADTTYAAWMGHYLTEITTALSRS